METDQKCETEDTIVKVLLIEDNPGDARLIREMLSEGRGNSFNLECTERLHTGLERLDEGSIDVVLLDLSLPDSQGFETIHRVQEQASEVPIVVLTGLDDESLGMKAVQEGAQDYLVKGKVDANLLVRATHYAIERKKVERREKEVMEIKSQFVSMVSHELRTPLTAIKDGIGIVLDGSVGEINQKQGHFLSLAKRNVDRLHRLINDILDFAKLESGRVEFRTKRNDINEAIKEVVETHKTLAEEKGLYMRMELTPNLQHIQFDFDRIVEVMNNLINNALKHTKEGGITVKSLEDEEEKVIRVHIKDTGEGIREEDVPRLFKKFQQVGARKDRASGSTGLGLAICREIVDKHNGRIWVESVYGRGSEFIFVLPA